MLPRLFSNSEKRPGLYWSEVLTLDVVWLLWFYCRLRLEVLRGAHKTQRPLGIVYRWRDWEYQQPLKRVESKSWSA